MEAAHERISGETVSDQSLVIVNICHFVMVIMTGAFFLGLLTDLGTDGTMRWVVAAAVILFSDLAFAGVGVALIVAARYTHVRLTNHLLPWVTLIVLSVIPVTEAYDSLTGPVSDAQVAWIGLGASALLTLWAWIETAHVRHRVSMDVKY